MYIHLDWANTDYISQNVYLFQIRWLWPIICILASCVRKDLGKCLWQGSNNLCPRHLHLIRTSASPWFRSGAGGLDTDYWILVVGFCLGPFLRRGLGHRLYDHCQRIWNRFYQSMQSLHCSGLEPVQPLEQSLWQMYGWDSGVRDWGSGVFVLALFLCVSLSELAI